jgi:outer membrane protein TolC
LALLLAACGAIQPKLATDPNSLAPPTAAKLWAPEEATRIPGGKATLDAFSARSDPPPAAIQPGRVYDLPKLIDLAQQTNPETRAAWQEARAAAARLGIAEGAYLPTLGAIGMASYSHLPDYDKMGPFLVGTGVLEHCCGWIGCWWTSVDAAPISRARPRPCLPPISSSTASSKA